ncbi:MAG: OmpA family protein [Alphaproteobacteria bacterium]|nr:OmpA family protein [Alphaproteobacteria bacterium]
MGMKRIVMAGAGLAMLTGVAHAEHYSWYISGGAGGNWMQDVDTNINSASQTTELSPGWAGALAGGYNFDGARIELELGYRDNDADSLEQPSGTFLDNLEGDVTQFSQMVNVLFDLPVTDKLAVTIGGGLGGVDVDGDYTLTTVGTSVRMDDYAFAYQAIAGASYDVTEQLELFAEYRYFVANDVEAVGYAAGGAALPGPDETDLKSHTGLIGVRYYLTPPAAPAPVAEPAVVPPAEPALAKTFIVFFDFNKSNLTAEAQTVVAEAAEVFKAGGNIVLVVGHTDTVGSAGYNQKLSERRAANVKAEMVRLGVPADVITTEGRGFAEPLVPTGPGVKEPQNRRAVIDIK